MRMKKRRIWLLTAAVCMIILSAAALLVIPRVILVSALAETGEALTQRFEGDPLRILLRALDPEGKYTLSGSLELTGSYPEALDLEGVLEADLKGHRFWAGGTASASDKTLDFALYMDPGCLAVSSRQLTEGNYYGITYDSFSEDIRRIPLLNVFISDAVFARWEESLQTLREQILREYPLPQLPELPEDMHQTLTAALLTLPYTAENRTLTENDETLVCRALTYSLKAEELKEAFPQLQQETAAAITFYLNRSRMAAVQCLITSGGETNCWFVKLGQNPKTEPLVLQYTGRSGDITTIVTDTQKTENRYRESWEITAKGEKYSLFYDREQESGKMLLRINDALEACEVFLTETDQGISFRSSQLEKLLQTDEKGSWRPASCELNLEKGSGIAVPAYKNLDQWSLEDFLILAEGIGTWIGLRFN